MTKIDCLALFEKIVTVHGLGVKGKNRFLSYFLNTMFKLISKPEVFLLFVFSCVDLSHGIGMSFTEFKKILNRDCSNELASLSSADAQEVWIEATGLVWDDIYASDRTHSFPFLVGSSKEGSGYSRKVDLQNNFFADITDSISELEVTYNADDQTIFSVQVQSGAAETMQDAFMMDGSGLYYMQPLLPMCKLNDGLMASSQSRFSSGVVPATLQVQFGDDMESSLIPGSKDSVVSDLELYNIGYQNDLQEVFPVNWQAIQSKVTPSSSTQITETSSSFSRDSVRIVINRESTNFNSDELLSFVSGIAIRSDVVYVELMEEVTIGVEGNGGFGTGGGSGGGTFGTGGTDYIIDNEVEEPEEEPSPNEVDESEENAFADHTDLTGGVSEVFEEEEAHLSEGGKSEETAQETVEDESVSLRPTNDVINAPTIEDESSGGVASHKIGATVVSLVSIMCLQYFW